MTRRTIAWAAAAVLVAVAAQSASTTLAAPPAAAAAQPAAGGPWTNEDYVPSPGLWRPYVLAPADRDVAPRAVLAARPRSGAIEGDPAAALRADGRSVRLTSTGDRTGSPLLTLDFGREVAGRVRVRLLGGSVPALHACFSESRRYLASGTRNDGQAAHAPGCDTANIWNGFPGVPYAADTDSHVLALPDRLPATVTDPQRRGGFRYLTLFLDGPGAIDVDAVSLDFTAAPLQRRPADYAGSFLSSDHLLNKIWYAGAYTVQINTDLPGTAKRWPYQPGERDHADARVPFADPDKEVIFDGGKRDRIVWQGDLAVQSPATYVSTADLDAVENSLSSLAAQQEPDGFVPAASQVGPHNAGEKRTYGEYVTWFVSNLALHYRWTGDRAYLDRWYPALEKAVAWLESVRERDDRGLISFGAVGSCGHYGYSDCGHETYINALYKRNLDQMAELATARGDAGAGARYRARAAAVAGAIDEQLWDEDAGAYRLSRELPDVYPQDGNAAAVLAGVASGSRARRALDQLRQRNWSRLGSLTVDPDASNPSLPPFYAPLPSWFEVDARLGASDPRGLGDQGALDLVRRFWGYQLEQDPQSTFVEHLRPDGTPNLSQFSSLAHGWAAGPTVSLTTHVLGVAPTAPGFERFEVVPHPGDLRWAEGTVPTPRGPIRASWRRDGDRAFSLDVTVPGRSRARVAMPTFGREVRVRVDGRSRPTDTAPGTGAGYVTIDDLGPGLHHVTTRAVDRPPRTSLQLVAIPRITRTEPGETVALRAGVSGVARGRLAGEVRTTAPDGWIVSPERPGFDLRSGGRPASDELRVYAVVPQDAPSGSHTVRFEAVTRDGARATATATVALSTTRTLFDFESGTQGWRPGENVERIDRVTAFPNGPGRPVQGEAALDATVRAVPASAPKSVTVTPDQPLDLSAAREVHAQLDCYGGAPGAEGYEATFTLRSGDKTLSRTTAITCDRWNRLALDVTGWPERRQVTAIEVGFRALGTDAIWLPHFQIDDVGYSG